MYVANVQILPLPMNKNHNFIFVKAVLIFHVSATRLLSWIAKFCKMLAVKEMYKCSVTVHVYCTSFLP